MQNGPGGKTAWDRLEIAAKRSDIERKTSDCTGHSGRSYLQILTELKIIDWTSIGLAHCFKLENSLSLSLSSKSDDSGDYNHRALADRSSKNPNDFAVSFVEPNHQTAKKSVFTVEALAFISPHWFPLEISIPTMRLAEKKWRLAAAESPPSIFWYF